MYDGSQIDSLNTIIFEPVHRHTLHFIRSLKYVAVGSDAVHWLACSLSDPGDSDLSLHSRPDIF